MSKAIRLGKIFGIGFALDYSWFVVIILGIWSLARQYLPAAHPGWSLSTYWVSGTIVSALFLMSVAAHELARGVVARKLMVPARNTTLFLFGGTPEISEQSCLPHQEVLIALAGPGVSLSLAAISYALLQQGLGVGWPLHALISWLAWLNLMLFLVNLLPAYPLAGGQILHAVIWDGANNQRRATAFALDAARFIALSVLFYGSWLVFWQLRSGSWGDGLWIVIAGWLLHRTVTQSERRSSEHNRDLLSGYTVRNATLTSLPRALHRLTLDILMDQVAPLARNGYILVVKDEKLEGLLSVDRITLVPQGQWPVTRVEDVMVSVSRLKTIQPDTTLTTALDRMIAEHERELVVIEGERPLGIITHETVLSFLDGQTDDTSALVAAHCPIE